jgi:hypothetical protein
VVGGEEMPEEQTASDLIMPPGLFRFTLGTRPPFRRTKELE